ncbi:hypothetical protein [Rhizobium sp. RCAM05973]|jgi:hypothetical protein|uniref:hypothetical protein n=1 Tax=Rhizobium sp. RCAM05973 TaxID=2994066 RepID=UPI0022EBF2A6|nr:hypothetical protein [Rhizobium sp. RCAM05973]
MADKQNKPAEPEAEEVDSDPRNRIDLNDPHMSGQEASERALGYHKEEPKAE